MSAIRDELVMASNPGRSQHIPSIANHPSNEASSGEINATGE